MIPQNIITGCWTTPHAAETIEQEQKWYTEYKPEYVNRLYDQFAAVWGKPFNFYVMTDHPLEKFKAEIICLDVNAFWPAMYSADESKGKGQFKLNWRKLHMFTDVMQVVGERFMWIDLDSWVVKDFSEIYDLPYTLIGTPDHVKPQYNTSLLIMDTGSHGDVYNRWLAAGRPFRQHTDQEWFNEVAFDRVHRVDQYDGIYNYKHLLRTGQLAGRPNNLRMIYFPGRPKQWEDNPMIPGWARL